MFTVLAAALMLVAGFAAVLTAAPGGAAEHWVLWDAAGERHALTDQRGKIVLLLVGDAQAPVWDHEPVLRAMIERYGSLPEIELLAVQQGGDAPSRAAGRAALADQTPLLLDPANHTAALYDTTGPSVVVLGQDGTPSRVLPLEDNDAPLDATVQALLARS
jgi:hypothetical protein